MDIRQTLLLYLLVGAGVAIGFAARGSDKGRAWSTMLAAWVFWPLFMPLLLSAEEEVAATPPSEPLAARIARGGELLDRLVATSSTLGIPDLPEQANRIQALWAEQAAWLSETGLLIQALKTTHSKTTVGAMPPNAPQIEELHHRQRSTEASLDRSLNGMNQLAVHVQLLKAPGVDRTAELERIERVLKAILEVDDAEGQSSRSFPE